MNYPNGIKNKIIKKEIHYDNRGMSLEEDLNISNLYYQDKKIAYIYKKPTPIQITKVDYPSRNKAVIKEAYFKEPSTTDYNGLYKGRYIDFEAKSTNLKSLPFKNISKHQIEHLNKVVSHGGIAFFIINFRTLKETYFLPFEELQQFLQSTNRKSISVNTIKKKGQLIKGTIFIPINYVECLDLYLSKNEKIL